MNSRLKISAFMWGGPIAWFALVYLTGFVIHDVGLMSLVMGYGVLLVMIWWLGWGLWLCNIDVQFVMDTKQREFEKTHAEHYQAVAGQAVAEHKAEEGFAGSSLEY